MYSLRIHDAVKEEFAQLKAKNVDLAADVYVLISEVFTDSSVIQAMVEERYGENVSIVNIVRFLEMWHHGQGDNIWRVKVQANAEKPEEVVEKMTSLSALKRLRFFYGLNRAAEEVWLLAFRERTTGKQGKDDIYDSKHELRKILSRRCRECGCVVVNSTL